MVAVPDATATGRYQRSAVRIKLDSPGRRAGRARVDGRRERRSLLIGDGRRASLRHKRRSRNTRMRYRGCRREKVRYVERTKARRLVVARRQRVTGEPSREASQLA